MVTPSARSRPSASAAGTTTGSASPIASCSKGYTVTPANLRLGLPARQTVQTHLVVKSPGPTAPPLSRGEITVATPSGGTRDEFRGTLRLARGVVAYVDTRPVRLAAAEDARRMVPLACLHNRYQRAEFIRSSGTLHSLIPRFAGRDFLLEGDYPIGLVWYGMSGGYTQTELTGRPGHADTIATWAAQTLQH